MHEDLEAVRLTINGATLSADARRIATWSMEQLPKLYGNLLQAYDSRFADEILCRVQTLLKALGEQPDMAQAVSERLVAMHERLGLPKLAFKTTPIRATRKRKLLEK